MFKQLLLGSVLAGMTFAFAVSANAQTAQLDRWVIGDWTGALIKDDAGYFERCVAAVQFQNGSTISVSVTYRGELQLRFTDDRWNVAVGRTYLISLSVDGQSVLSSQASPTRPGQLLLSGGQDYSLLEALRRGRRLDVASDLATLDGASYSLRDSSAALFRMAQCFPASVPRTQISGRAVSVTGTVPMKPDANLMTLQPAMNALTR